MADSFRWFAHLTISLSFYAVLLCRAHPARILHDQRQQGELNFHGSAENVVLVLVPTHGHESAGGGPSSTSAPSSLLDYFRSIEQQRQQQQQQRPSKGAGDNADNLRHFIEAKSMAPYSVDLSMGPNRKERRVDAAAAIVLLPSELKENDENRDVLRQGSSPLATVIPEDDVDGLRRVGGPEQVLLLGAELEQCGPGLERDGIDGVCKPVIVSIERQDDPNVLLSADDKETPLLMN